jgi:hypothetical protein
MQIWKEILKFQILRHLASVMKTEDKTESLGFQYKIHSYTVHTSNAMLQKDCDVCVCKYG